MKRLTLLGLGLLVATLFLAAHGATAGAQQVSWTLGGSATWGGTSFLADTFSIDGDVQGLGSYSGTFEAASYFTTDTCGPQCATVTGTLQFVTRQGTFNATVQPGGLVTVASIGSGTTYSFDLTLSIGGGTRSYAHASGTLRLVYESQLPTNRPECAVCPIVDGGTVTGAITRSPA
jgi:hypothetical protein